MKNRDEAETLKQKEILSTIYEKNNRDFIKDVISILNRVTIKINKKLVM